MGLKVVQIIGIDRLVRKLDPDHLLGDEVRDIVPRAARAGDERSVKAAPHLSGALASSIDLTANSSAMTAQWSTALPYAKAQEGGRYFPSTGRRSRKFRYMAKGKGTARAVIKKLILEAERAIRARWNAA